MNPDCKWKQEEFGYIYYLRALSLQTRLKRRTLRKAGAGRHVVGYGITARWDFELPTKTLITRFVNKYRILASSDTASNASTLGISNPDPLPQHNNTYPNLLELTRRSYFILFYFIFNCGEFSPFCEKYSGQRISCIQLPVLVGKTFQGKTKKLLKVIAKNLLSCLEYERVLNIFYFSYFGYSQFWLNILYG
jgi:hypothetical protein